MLFTAYLSVSATFLDYGPYATLGIDPPQISTQGMSHMYNLYGDERGYAYARSLRAFVQGIGPEIEEYVENTLDNLSRGAMSIDKKVAALCKNDISPEDEKMSAIVSNNELGQVDVMKELENIRNAPGFRKMISDLEKWSAEKIDIHMLGVDLNSQPIPKMRNSRQNTAGQ